MNNVIELAPPLSLKCQPLLRIRIINSTHHPPLPNTAVHILNSPLYLLHTYPLLLFLLLTSNIQHLTSLLPSHTSYDTLSLTNVIVRIFPVVASYKNFGLICNVTMPFFSPYSIASYDIRADSMLNE